MSRCAADKRVEKAALSPYKKGSPAKGNAEPGRLAHSPSRAIQTNAGDAGTGKEEIMSKYYVVEGPVFIGNKFGYSGHLLPEGQIAVVEDGEHANGGRGPSVCAGPWPVDKEFDFPDRKLVCGWGRAEAQNWIARQEALETLNRLDSHDHEYATFNCPACGKTLCWNCAVRCTDDGSGDGIITCPTCGERGDYLNGTDHWPGYHIDSLARYILAIGGDEARTRRQIEEKLRLALK